VCSSDLVTINGFLQLSADQVNPGANDTYYDGVDANCDGAEEFDQDKDTFYTSQYPDRNGNIGDDCEDDNPQVNPDQLEDCATASDDDCNGDANEINAIGCEVYYNDADQDGYGTSTSLCLCEAKDNFSADNEDDCDDAESTTNPGADEYCDGHDDDCDEEIDEDDSVDALTWYQDSDLDGYGDSNNTTQSCYQNVGYVANSDDCDDTNADTNPGADEVCDGDDNDCDGDTDENDAIDATVWYLDSDGDGYGSPDSIAIECDQPSGYSTNDEDCDDTNASVNPGATETKNEDDDDCDDTVDEGFRGHGDFYLTEISTMGSGTDPSGEWFEIYNPSTNDLYLDGVEIQSSCNPNASSFVLGVDGVVLTANGYIVLCHDDSVLGNLCDYVYGSDNNGSSLAGETYSEDFCLDENQDTLTLALDGLPIDDVFFKNGTEGWKTHTAGVSLVLHANYYGANSNDTASNWCYPGSSETYGSSSTGNGNPGAVMGTCNATFPNVN
jgi:hypothetical protein